MGKSTISMAMFNSYACLPEGSCCWYLLMMWCLINSTYMYWLLSLIFFVIQSLHTRKYRIYNCISLHIIACIYNIHVYNYRLCMYIYIYIHIHCSVIALSMLQRCKERCETWYAGIFQWENPWRNLDTDLKFSSSQIGRKLKDYHCLVHVYWGRKK